MTTNRVKNTIFWTTVLGTFLAVYDSTGVNVALYKIANAFNEPIATSTWIIVAYMLTLTTFLPMFGKLGDVLPRNKLYSSGFLLFTLGTILASLSITLPFLIFSRCIEALGASIIFANAPAFIATIFKGQERGKALGINGAVIALAGMISPSISGIIMKFTSWNFIFIPSMLLGILGIILSYKFIPHTEIKKNFKFDIAGFIYFAIFLVTFLLILFRGYDWGINSLPVLICFFLGLISFIFFIFKEKKSKYPIIDFKLFKHKSFSYGNLALILSYLPLCGNGIIYPIYAQHILGYSPFTTGLSMLPFSIVLTITAPISGTLAGRYGSRYLTVSGALLMGCSAFLFSSFNSKTTIIYILLAHATMGLANGLFQSPTNNAIFTHINRNQTGVASGVLGLSRNTGMIIGTSSAIAMLEIFKNLQLYTLGENLAFMYAYKNTLHLLVFIAVICASVAFYAHGTKSEVRPQDLTKYQQP